jgi:hypothetical protein
MSWLVLGSISSLVLKKLVKAVPRMKVSGISSVYFVAAPFWIPAIGGMVMVGLELREYGVCVRID